MTSGFRSIDHFPQMYETAIRRFIVCITEDLITLKTLNESINVNNNHMVIFYI